VSQHRKIDKLAVFQVAGCLIEIELRRRRAAARIHWAALIFTARRAMPDQGGRVQDVALRAFNPAALQVSHTFTIPEQDRILGDWMHMRLERDSRLVEGVVQPAVFRADARPNDELHGPAIGVEWSPAINVEDPPGARHFAIAFHFGPVGAAEFVGLHHTLLGDRIALRIQQEQVDLCGVELAIGHESDFLIILEQRWTRVRESDEVLRRRGVAASGVGAPNRGKNDVARFDLFPPRSQIDLALPANAGHTFLGNRVAVHGKAAARLVNQKVECHHAGAHAGPSDQPRNATLPVVDVDAFVNVENRAPCASFLAGPVPRTRRIV
jgi:hypothetical protein